jgi:L-histidine N-alpha-methyltransferase
MTMTTERHLTPGYLDRALREDVRQGLTADPKVLPPKWFYDAKGSDLFEEITRLPEYYPTRREAEILSACATEIAELMAADTLVELGSGSSEKTRLLLDAMRATGTLTRYVPVDVSDSALLEASEKIMADYPGLVVHGVIADFEAHLDRLPGDGRRSIAFLGSTIGNLDPPTRAKFLAEIAAGMSPGDTLLLGTDLVKPVERLIAAYDDSQGVTAAFNKNVLSVINRELGADFDLDGFEHLAVWNAEEERIEMRLRSLRPQSVTVADLDLTVSFAEGEQMRTEISTKFRRERLDAELSAAGMTIMRSWTDSAGDFGVTLAELA